MPQISGTSPQPATSHLFSRGDLAPDVLTKNFSAGAILAILSVSRSIAIAALVFTGPLIVFLPAGVTLFLMGNALTALIVAMLSGYRAIGPTPKIGHSPIFAAMALSIVAIMADAPPEAQAATVIATIMIATVATGAVMALIGVLKLGALARSIPYPVMGGFIAGLGYLIIRGGVSVSVGAAGSVSHPATLLQPAALALVAPAVAFAVLLFALSKTIKHWAVLPALLGLAIAGFHLVLLATGTSLAEAGTAGWVPDQARPGSVAFPPITLGQLGLVDLGAVAAQAGAIVVLVLLSLISLLLGVGGIEVVVNRDLDPNREMIAAGVGNMIGGLAASALTFHTLSQTTLGHKLGGDRFLMICVYSAVTALAIAYGPSLTTVVPLFVLGGLLIYTGLGSLIDWCWSARKKLPLHDYLVVMAVLIVVAWQGLLEGVAFGIALAVLLFVHRYSRLSIIHAQFDGSQRSPNIDRAPAQMAYLDSRGGDIQVFLLRGYIFFASANQLLEKVRGLLRDAEVTGLRFIILDLARVEGLDSSAINTVTKMMQGCRRLGIQIIFTGGTPDVVAAIVEMRNGLGLSDRAVRLCRDLDEGLGLCHEAMLRETTAPQEPEAEGTAAFLRSVFGDTGQVTAMAAYFQVQNFDDGALVFHQGDPGDAAYLIERGSIAISLRLENGAQKTVRTIRSGAIFGEISLYTGEDRTATARAVGPVRVLRLTAASLSRMRQDARTEAELFDGYIIRLMADRTSRANREIVALSS